MSATEPKRRGRPPKAADERKGANLTFRTRADFRARLEEAAEKSGRSVTEEVELRVERSFEADATARRLDDVLSVFFSHGPHALEFVKDVMVAVSQLHEQKAPDGRLIGSEDWPNSPATRVGVRKAVELLLDHHVGNDQGEGPDFERMKAIAVLSARFASGNTADLIEFLMRQDDATTKDT